jgi:cyclic-di-AMP phosphodiesterase PgpH
VADPSGKSPGSKIPEPPKAQVLTRAGIRRRIPEFVRRRSTRSLVTRRWPLAALIAVVVAVFVSPHVNLGAHNYDVGDFTLKSIKAPRDVTIELRGSTMIRREEAASRVLPIYDFDPEQVKQAAARVSKSFGDARAFFNPPTSNGGSPVAKIIPKSEVDAVIGDFAKVLGVPLLDKDISYLKQRKFPKDVEKAARAHLEGVFGRMVVGSRKFMPDHSDLTDGSQEGITVRNLSTKKESEFRDLTTVFELEQIAAELAQNAEATGNKAASGLALSIAQGLVKPNLTFNKSETEDRKSQAREQIVPSVVEFKKNQLIVGEGVRITDDTLAILDSLYAQHSRIGSGLVFLAVGMLVFLVIVVFYKFAELNISKFSLSDRDALFLASMICATVSGVWLWMVVIGAVSEQFPALTQDLLMLMIPVAAATMVVRFLINSEVSALFAIVVSALAALVVDPSLTIYLYFLVGSLVGANFVGKASQRNTILVAGFYTGLANAAMILALGVALSPASEALSWRLLTEPALGILAGVLTGPLVLSFSPAWEWLFGYTSDVKLMEMANLNHPILKQMVMRAPGTYSHSTLVSSLAEGAAEAINCNPLLAKVGGLYHDIGKMNKPEYFYENLHGQDNKHDGLYPRMSGLILTSHVKEGVELGRRHNLGEKVVDLIQQHHGKNLIYYFYRRAKELEDPEKSLVDESDFRYPGPKPQTREAAIIMLADIVEASSRSMQNPTPTRIRQKVEEMIEKVFTDGQLDECNLTLRDLQKIGDSFNVILNGIFHSRIQYPQEPIKEETAVVNDSRQRPPETPDDI